MNIKEVRDLSSEELVKSLEEWLNNDNWNYQISMIIDNTESLQRYLNKRKDTMKRYKDNDGVKQKLKNYSKKSN